MPVFWWVGLDLVFLVVRAASSGVFCGVCELSMILGSLSANGWGCVTVFGMRHPALELAGHCGELVVSIEMEISGRALTDWYYMGPGGRWWSSVLNSSFPPQRLRPDTRLEHQDPVSHMVHKKREEKKKEKKIFKEIKLKLKN